jgi:hypothetical protein
MNAGARLMHSQLCRRAERGRFPVWIVSKHKETLMGIAIWIIIILVIAALIKYLLKDTGKK